MKLHGCSALITGASAGIGREFARQLAPRAGALVLVARRNERLLQLQAELRRTNPKVNVHVRAADLREPGDIEALYSWLQSEKIEIDFLINNAGVGDHGPFASSDLARVDDMIRLNIGALTALTHRLVQPMIARRHGAVLNVSSSAGFLPIPDMAVYAATKAYVTSFSEAIRAELRDSGVSVTSLCPGPVQTEFNDIAKRPGTAGISAPGFTHVSVEAVARAGLRAVEGDRPIVVPGAVMRLAMLLVRLTPMPLLRLASQFR
ncbi:MAG: SDR family NAD(P)-dependent oxidoreductase [Chthoniobacterales bacterium]